MKFIQVKDLYLLAVIALLKAVAWVAAPQLKNFVVHSIASAAYRLSRNKRRWGEENLGETFGKTLGKQERRRIVKRAFQGFWEDVFSFSLSPREKVALQGVELSGVEHLQNALRGGKGAILWESGSLGKRNLAKHILHENGFSLCQVHAERHMGGFTNRNSVTWVRRYLVQPFFERCEQQFVTEILYLPHSDSLAFTRRLLDRLRQNAIICITGDVGLGQKLIPQPFLGHTKLFATGMVSLAKISGASILPMFCLQERDGQTRLIIERPIHVETGVGRERGLEKSVAEYVGLLESLIRRYPEQYRSWHYVHRLSEQREPALATAEL
jgi:lauroyl/myristoyl acyltransferase